MRTLRKALDLLVEADSTLSWMLHRSKKEWDENQINSLIGRIRRFYEARPGLTDQPEVSVSLAHIEKGQHQIHFFFDGAGPLRSELLEEEDARYAYDALRAFARLPEPEDT